MLSVVARGNKIIALQVRFASVRRSLFAAEAERAKFLSQLVAGTRDILKQQQGLAEHSNYHEFCRMLGRLKTNYQLSELVRCTLPSSGYLLLIKLAIMLWLPYFLHALGFMSFSPLPLQR